MLLIALLLAASQDTVTLTQPSQVKDLCEAIRAHTSATDLDPAEQVAAQKAALARRDEALSRWYRVEIPSKRFSFGQYREQDHQLELDGARPVRAVDDALALDLDGIDDVAFNARPEQVRAWSREKKAGLLKLVVVWKPTGNRCAGSAAAESWRIAGRVQSWQLVGADGVLASANEDAQPVGGGPRQVRVERVALDSDGAPQENEGRDRFSGAQRALDRCASGAERGGTLVVSFSVQGGRVHDPQVIMDSLRDDRVSSCVARALAGADVGGSGRGTASIAVE